MTINKEYSSRRGLKNSLHGNIYQLKLLMLFLKKAFKKYDNFSLATEMDDAEKFDDIVLKYYIKELDKPSYRYLQAKHKTTGEVISDKSLLDTDDGDFSLKKYFLSYLKIKKNEVFKDGDLKEFMICTNTSLDFDEKKDAKRALKLKQAFDKIETIDEILDYKNIKSKRYKFKSSFPGKKEIYEILRSTSDADILAEQLQKLIESGTKIECKSYVLKKYNMDLLKHKIITIKSRGKKSELSLSDNFIDGELLDDWAIKLRKAFNEQEQYLFQNERYKDKDQKKEVTRRKIN